MPSQLNLQLFSLLPLFLRFYSNRARQITFFVDLIQKRIGGQLFRGNHRARIRNDFLIKTQSTGDRQRVRPPRKTDCQVVRGLKAFDIELHARVAYGSGAVRKNLQRREMCCYDSRYSAIEEFLEKGLRKSSALLWIGSGAKLIEYNERSIPSLRQYADDVGNMR